MFSSCFYRQSKPKISVSELCSIKKLNEIKVRKNVNFGCKLYFQNRQKMGFSNMSVHTTKGVGI